MTTALLVVKTVLDALKAMDADSPWITLFDRESRHAKTARFQMSLAEQQADGQCVITLLAFTLEATKVVTQVLFFKWKKTEAKVRHDSGRVSLSSAVLDDPGVREALKKKLAAISTDFILEVPVPEPRRVPLSARAARAATGRRGLSLHIGLNFVDPKHYEGWDGELAACEFDAKDMRAIAAGQGLTPTTLLTRKATRARVLAGIPQGVKVAGERRPVPAHLLGPRWPGARRHRRRARQVRRDLVPLGWRAAGRRAVSRAREVPAGRPRAGAVGQLSQRHGDSRRARSGARRARA